MQRTDGPGPLERLGAWAGRVPLRTKMIGIVVSAIGGAGFVALIWFHVRMSQLLGSAGASGPTMEWSEPVFVAALAVVVGSALAWLLTLILTRPVLDVTRVARRIHQGDLSRRAPIRADDELGELAATLNSMIDRLVRSQQTLETANARLKAQNAELSLLFALADMSARTTSARDLLAAGLARIVEATGADAGLVLWLDEDGTLGVAGSRGLPQPVRASVQRALDDGRLIPDAITAWCGELAGGATLPAPLAGVARAASDEGFRALSTMPIRVRDGVKGGILLLDRTGRHRACEASSLLEAVSSQLGVAVENASLWHELKEREAMRARLLAQAVTAQEQERERISRELHDETGQALTALLVQLKVLERLRDPDAVAAHAQELREIAVGTLEEVRRLARDLRPATLDDLGLVATLDGHVKTFRRKADLDVEFDADVPDGFRLPRDMELALYRVVQEALTNVARHAGATEVRVRLEQVSDVLSLSVVDNGRGFDPAALRGGESGVGLLGIRERVELIGGVLTLQSAPGQGTRLRVDVELETAGRNA